MSYLVLCFTIKPLLWEDPKIFFSHCLWSVKENCKFTLLWANNSSVWKINFKVLLYQDAFYSMLCWCHVTRMQVIKDIFTLSSLPCIRQSVGLLFKDKGLHKIKNKKSQYQLRSPHVLKISVLKGGIYISSRLLVIAEALGSIHSSIPLLKPTHSFCKELFCPQISLIKIKTKKFLTNIKVKCSPSELPVETAEGLLEHFLLQTSSWLQAGSGAVLGSRGSSSCSQALTKHQSSSVG